jgi:hypothetical protein
VVSDRWIPRVGEEVGIADRPGWTGQVREIIHRGGKTFVRLMPQPPQPPDPPHPVTEDVVPLENVTPHHPPAD